MKDNKMYKVGLTPKGTWNKGISYERLDFVLYRVEDGGDGCGYVAKNDNIGITPGTNDNIWMKSVEHGQSIYDLVKKYGDFDGTEEEFEQQYLKVLQDARDATSAVEATDIAIRDAESERAANESARVAAELARGNTENARSQSETERVNAERGRVSAEQRRVQAEADRNTAESARVSSENSRESAETSRANNESSRTLAENARRSRFAALETDMETAIGQADASVIRANDAIANVEDTVTAMVAAEGERVQAEDARIAAEKSRASAEDGRAVAETNRETRANSDHTRAESDHSTAAADHTQANSDHTTAAADHTQAGADHTQAVADHTASEAATTAANTAAAAADAAREGIQDEVAALGQELKAKLIKLKGFGTSGASVGAVEIGDVYYNTISNTLQRKFTTEGSSTFEEVPFYKGAIYQYNNDLYTWNGERMLCHKRLEVDTISLSADPKSISIPDVGEICNLTPSVSSLFRYAILPVTEKSLCIINNGEGGNSARLWAWLDSNNVVLERADANEMVTNDIIYAPQSANKLVINSKGSWDGQLIGGELAELYNFCHNGIVDLQNQIEDIDTKFGEDLPITLSSEPESITCNQGVGNVCPLTPQYSSGGYHYAIIPCQEGDVFVINGAGASSARLWCFLDEDNIILSVAGSNLTLSEQEIIAPPLSVNLLINSNNGGVNYKKENSGIIPSIREINDAVFKQAFKLRVTPNINTVYDNNRKTLCLAGLKTSITDKAMPYTEGLLWHEYPNGSSSVLYYSTSIKDDPKRIGDLTGWNPTNKLFAISPKDGRVISTAKDSRAGICIFIPENNQTVILPSINGIIPCGWLYNSGVDFINDGDDEYCVFAEYGYDEVYYVWRGKYPYTSDGDWEIVLSKRGPLDSSPEITHFHTIRRDPWTDILYCTSGDYVGNLFWYYSTDKGRTWELLTNGSSWEDYCARNIGFIFTKDYAYWATDYGENHTFNRISRNPNTGILDISSREKLADLPYGQATNSICYVESLDGIFFYERLDSTFQDKVRGYYTLFYSLKENKLQKVNYYTLNEEDYQQSTGMSNNAWGGHRGKCYLNYANNMIYAPIMGFSVDSPCLINMIGVDNLNVGTIYYE